jgi:hypothetical protein
VDYDTLYAAWNRKLCGKPKPAHKKRVTAEMQCPCGNTQVYNTPMYRYIFGLVFEEYSTESV